MANISIPIPNELNEFIDEQVRTGKASSKADLVRRAIKLFKEEEFIKDVLEAEEDVKRGRVFKGDLDTIAKGFE
jgi:Arc/MetJ-type ribon-helix-helix transcriptional regulator